MIIAKLMTPAQIPKVNLLILNGAGSEAPACGIPQIYSHNIVHYYYHASSIRHIF